MTELETAWEKVHSEAARLKPVHLRELFAGDAARFDTLSASLDDFTGSKLANSASDRRSRHTCGPRYQSNASPTEGLRFCCNPQPA